MGSPHGVTERTLYSIFERVGYSVRKIPDSQKRVLCVTVDVEIYSVVNLVYVALGIFR